MSDREYPEAALTRALGAEVIREHPRLRVPDLTSEMMPTTWWLTAEPIIEAAQTEEELDDLDLQLEFFLGAVKALEQDATQIEKAKRVIERRRGELLGPPEHGGDRRSSEFQATRSEDDPSPATISR